MRKDRSEENSRRTENTGKKRKFGWTGIALVVVLVVGLGLTAGFGLDHYSRISPEFCASCHNMESHVSSYLDSSNLDNVHYQANVGCKDCHADYTVKDEMGSLWSYVTSDYDKVFRRKKIDDDMCTRCHISETYVAAQTDYLRRNPHLSHWPDLRCGACHISHDEQVDYCGRCHDNGGQRMTGDPIVPRADNPYAEG